ncbi:MAG: DNA repair protein RecO [Solobacterium sp.]|nr:DNA repair protein RecO [Solobacterium sp.]
MNDRVEGLIIREADFKDSSVIITVLTEPYGKISFVARGIRKMTSKNRGSLLPYTKGEFFFDYREGKTMFSLKTAGTKELYRFVHEDLNASLAAGVLAEVIDSFLVDGTEGSVSLQCFRIMEESLTLLNEKHRADIVLAAALGELTALLGIAPDVDECVLCGNTSVAAISVKEGGFLCTECALRYGALIREPIELKRFRLVNKAGLAHVPVLKEHMEGALAECGILVDLIRMHGGLPVKSYALFQRMFSG